MPFRTRLFGSLGIATILFSSISATAAAAPDRAVGVFRAIPVAAAEAPRQLSGLDQNTPAPVTFDECRKDVKNGYWTKNRFASCTITDMAYQRYACPEAGCAVIGAAWARVISTSNLLPAQRRLEVATRMVGWSLSGVVTDAMKFGVSMSCGPRYTTGTAHCDTAGAQVLKSVADWRAQSDETRVFTMEGTDPASPADSPPVRAEQRTWYVGERHLVAEDTGGRTTLVTGAHSAYLRCDVARLLDPAYAAGSDCAFGFQPLYVLDNAATSGFPASAALVRTAMTGFPTTYPGLRQGHFVPGNPGYQGTGASRTYPITRLHHDTAAQAAHRATAEQACAQRWGPGYANRPDGLVNTCAVYPFDTTYDGATLPAPGVERGASYAVQPVLDTDYQALLASVRQFVVANHLLDGDGYWVYPYA
ncbi:transporter [Amycolatopsis sp. NBC_01307]|uniref:transporter n=1 Tax=Amycolatopsis sp. NBC_01307 TaxID=2903561 RepID=UPI002E0EFD15|nr:transporter [Amycolatopsis sp. NBC_01307]